jgi:small nuclear ribonucleoprotein (snRNP)-like protein
MNIAIQDAKEVVKNTKDASWQITVNAKKIKLKSKVLIKC